MISSQITQLSQLSAKVLSSEKILQKSSTDLEYQKILDTHKYQFDKLWARKMEPSGPLIGFDLVRVLSSGAFGQVILGKHKITNMHYAIKVQQKAMLVKCQQVLHVFFEKKVLLAISYPLVVSMDFCFKDEGSIYFVMPFVNGGDLFSYLRRVKKVKEDLCRFYGAQIVLALEYLHYVNLVYRDLKPENVTLDRSGYIKICDFGFCKYVTTRTWSLCGTPDYLAPEVLQMKGYGQSVDWWGFGVFLYELSAGFPPFFDDDPLITFEKIITLKYRFPSEFSVDLKDLIRNLLQVDLSRRYGMLKRGVSDIKNHKFFRNINWMDIYEQNTKPLYVPQVRNESDTRYFDTKEEIDIVQEEIDKYEKEFIDF